MNKLVWILVIGFLAIDSIVAIVFVVPPDYLAVMAARVSLPSECSLAELVRENRATKAALAAASKPTLERTEAGLDLWNTLQGRPGPSTGTPVLSF